jgi:fructokinase
VNDTSVACFGEALWDVYETGPDTFRRELGGAPTNLAVALARLGVRASIVCGVSKDAFGDALVSRLRKNGVDTRGVVRLPNRTGLAFVRRDSRGQPSFLFYRHETADMMVRPEHLRASMAKATFAVLGTSTLVREPLASATWRFVDLAKKAGAAIAVDLNVRAHLWKDKKTMRTRIGKLVSRAALLKASREDLHALGGVPFLEKHARDATWILTSGAGTAHADGAHGDVSMKALRGKCVDATGAGDAFFAGVLAVLVARGAVPGSAAWRDPAVFSDALRVGHMLGRKVVSRVGAVTGLVGLGAAKKVIRA